VVSLPVDERINSNASHAELNADQAMQDEVRNTARIGKAGR